MNDEVESSTQQVENSKPRKRSQKKIWIFRFIAICFPLMFIVGLELVLRLFGIGTDLHLIQKIDGTDSEYTHRLNPSIELAYYSSEVTGPEPRLFTMPKPKNVYRIVCLGGSTVIGFPYSSELAFPRQIEVLLKQQNPEMEFEVLNAGVTSMNSFVVADLSEEALECDPDLLIIHTGHNEFYGPGGPASSVGNSSSKITAAIDLLRRTRIGQLLTRLKPSVSDQENLLDALPVQFEIPLDSDVVRQAEKNLRENLNRIIKNSQAANVPVVISSVSSNLKDQSPLRAFWSSSEQSQRSAWEQLVTNGEANLLGGDFEKAFSSFREAEKIYSDHSRLKFRQAQAFQGLNRNKEAAKAYQLARDLDGCRFRAPSSFRLLTEQVVKDQKSEQISWVDIAGVLQAKSHPAGPGYDFYLEHVHYLFEGHFELALAFAEHIQINLLNKKWNTALIPDLKTMKSLTGYISEDDLAAYSLSMEVLKTAPFRECLDLERHYEHTVSKIGAIYANLPEQRQLIFADLPMEMVGDQLLENLRIRHQLQGDREFAEALETRKVLRLRGLGLSSVQPQ